LYYTASGIVKPVGGRPVRRLREERVLSQPVHRTASTCFEHCCAHHEEVKLVLYSIWYHHTCRWPSGAQVERGIINLYMHIYIYNKLIIKQEFVY